MIFTTDNNAPQLFILLLLLVKAVVCLVPASAQIPDNYKCYYDDGIDNVFHQNHANLF